MHLSEQLIEKVKNAGVVGAGGAGFPTHIKIDAQVEIVIANGAECEPLLCTDQRTMETAADGIVSGVKLVMEAVGAKQGIIAVKAHYHEAITSLSKAIASGKNIKLHKMGNYYPAGDEHVLVLDATGRIIPEGGIPLHAGVLVNNVNTLLNIHYAFHGEPVVRQGITVCGEVHWPRVLRVPIGVSFKDLIALCGGARIEDYAILVGGPMMGRLAGDCGEPVTKTTSGIVVLPKDHPYVMRRNRTVATEIRMSKSICEQCRYCTDFCPRWLQGHSLEPHKIMRVIDYDRDLDTDTITRAFLCCECGVCDLYACPMALSPRVVFREFKGRLAEAGIKNPHSRSCLAQDQYRDYRKIPKDRLIQRLGLKEYDVHPEWEERDFPFSNVKIPLRQHIGATAVPVVKAGDKVKQGQLVGEIPEGKMGARIHASMDGTVAEVNGNYVGIKNHLKF
jgi:Na+-translocating ferredoxin:NAD+ oxidoreductase RnfC subunit